MSNLQRNTSMKRLQKQLSENENHPRPSMEGPPLHAPTPLRQNSMQGPGSGSGSGTGTPPSGGGNVNSNPFGFGTFTAIDEDSPLNSPFSSAPASRRGSFAHPHQSGPRPAIVRRRDSANWQEGAIDITGAPSLLSRAGSPTLPLMTTKTRSAASSRRGSFVGTPQGGFGGLGGQGFGMSGMNDLMNREKKKGEFVGSVDCGTTSTRFIVFDQYAKIICEHQMEFQQYYPHPGWHEHEPYDLVDSMNECIAQAIEKLEFLGFSASDIKCIGITNQRETVVCWDKTTGKPLCKTVVWDDARTVGVVREFQKKLDEEGLPFGDNEEDEREPKEGGGYFEAKKEQKGEGSAEDGAQALAEKLKNGLGVAEQAKKQGGDDALPTPTVISDVAISGGKRRRKGKEALVDITGLPLSTYFSAIKLKWLTDHHPEVRKAFQEDRLAFGTVDSWLLYNLTGGVDGGIHAIDCTNASRTLLMSLKTLQWYQPLIDFFGLKSSILPKIVSSSEVYGKIASGPLENVPIAGMVGDQQAALVGNKCLSKGQAKNTYGTGSFVLFNTGPDVVRSKNGLISTVAYRLGDHEAPTYALEGSIAVAGSAIKWLRDQVGLIDESAEMDALCSHVKDTGGVYFVTAFSGLLAPYWDPNAGGMIVGLTQYSTASHIARATLEAVCYQSRAVLDVIEQESGVRLDELKVDGGVTNSDLAMQIQADIGGFRVCRPHMRESTALGSALLAGHALKLFGWDLSKPETLSEVNMQEAMYFDPEWPEAKRRKNVRGWERAVERARSWHTAEEEDEAEAEFEKEDHYE